MSLGLKIYLVDCGGRVMYPPGHERCYGPTTTLNVEPSYTIAEVFQGLRAEDYAGLFKRELLAFKLNPGKDNAYQEFFSNDMQLYDRDIILRTQHIFVITSDEYHIRLYGKPGNLANPPAYYR
ncbi:hypothetical protein GGI00_001696 [Coemansia sp. RSA 2681]|nr:hypothetical protein GGI00_001696 [Coemansia sp. RSA 2681]